VDQRLDRLSGLHPSLESAVQGVHVAEAPLGQLSRHTGARMLARSGAVGDDGAVARDVPGVAGHVVRRHPDGPRDLGLRLPSDRAHSVYAPSNGPSSISLGSELHQPILTR